MRLSLHDAAAYSVLLNKIHHKHFTRRFDGSDYHSDGAGGLEYLWCRHGGETYRMTKLDEVVRHIWAFGV